MAKHSRQVMLIGGNHIRVTVEYGLIDLCFETPSTAFRQTLNAEDVRGLSVALVEALEAATGQKAEDKARYARLANTDVGPDEP
jgi:hypothetical protein